MCRRWKQAATPLLYEHISVASEDQLQRFTSAFSPGQNDPKANDIAPACHFLSMVKRLDVLLFGEASYAAASQLVTSLPELVTFVVMLGNDTDAEQGWPLLRALRQPSLKHFYWRHRIVGDGATSYPQAIPFSLLADFMADHPNLTTLCLPLDFQPRRPNDNATGNRSMSWPSIRYLDLQTKTQQEVLSHLPSGAFPSLQSVRTSWPETLSAFLFAHGEQLRSICIVYSPLAPRISPGSLLDTARNLEKCPHLHRLEMSIRLHAGYDVDPFGPNDIDALVAGFQCRTQHITVLALQHNAPQEVSYQDRCYQAARSITLPWTALFPKLNTIQLLDDVEMDVGPDSLNRKEIKSMMMSPGRYAAQDIRVEDKDGRHLISFSKGISAVIEDQQP